jgi:putative membrane protein
MLADLKKFHSLTFFFMFCVFVLSSCGNQHKATHTESGEKINVPDPGLTMENDKQFLVSATAYINKEILIGKLAKQRGTDQTVIDLGTMMEEAHREDKSKLASLAIIKSISIPDASMESAMTYYDKLNEESKADFDLSYCLLTIQNHQEAIHLFQTAMLGKLDPDIQVMASAMLPGIQARLAQARICETQLNPTSELVREP